MWQANGTRNFTKGATTVSNRGFNKICLNVMSVSLATNNRNHPSVGMTKTYNNNQRVKGGGKLLNLKEAVGYNVGTILSHLNKKWTGNKKEQLIGTTDVVALS